MKSAVDNTALFLKKARAVKVKTYLSCFVLCFVSFVCKADVLGPYITGQETIGDGYGRVVCVMYNTEYGSGSLTISDEDGTEYTLTGHVNGGAPNCYLAQYGTYTVTAVGDDCTVGSNWGIATGSTFTVSGSGYMTITKTAPLPKAYVYGPYLINTSGDTARKGYNRIMVVPVTLSENVVISPVEDTSVSIKLRSNYSCKNSEGKVVPFAYYILPGSYKIKSISCSRASYNFNLNTVYVGDTITISNDNMFYLTK